MKLILPFPPSVNTYWRAPNKGPLAGRHLISADGRKYQSAACVAIIEQLRRLPKPSTELAAVEITLYLPDARRRDIDNYNKALFDALTHAGVWEDDSQIKRMLVEWGPVVPKGRVFPRNSPLLPRSENRHKKTSHKGWFLKEFLVGTRGFEPPTPDTP